MNWVIAVQPSLVRFNRMKKRRIAILMHQSDSENTVRRYLINLFKKYWQQDGHEVFYLFGTDRFAPADLIFVHVDLSEVPKSYLEFARQYPVAVNGKIRNIKKSTFSQNLLHAKDQWDGPVIVKTEKNAAGVPERWRGNYLKKIQNKLLSAFNIDHSDLKLFSPRIKSPYDYPVYNHISEVPRHYFYHPGLIVQKFTPEREDGYYCLRYMSFLGDRITCSRLKSRNPIVTGASTDVVEHSVNPHSEILAMREKLNFDYGKFDYVVVNGNPLLLDTNKTVGCSPNLLDNDEMKERRKFRAQGLYSFFRD